MKVDDYFNGCLYFSLAKLQRRINNLAEEAFKPIGMVPSHAFLLMALDEKPEIYAGELADLLGLAPSTITRFIDKLEKQKLCKRRPVGRQATISITKQGKNLMPEIRQAWNVLYRLYSDELGEDAASDLNKMVVAFNSN